MEIFEYLARDQEGKKIKGKIEAPNKKRAAALLREKNLIIIALTPKREEGGFFYQLKRLQKVGDKDKATFTRLLSTMLATGLTITDAIENLAYQTENPRFKEVISEMLRDIEGGASFSAALSRHKEIFDEIYISLVKTGEAAGTLDKTLKRLAESLEKDREFKGKIKGALLYPAIVTVAMIGVATLMLVVVIPKISAVYEEAGASLPLPTLLMIGLSKLVVGKWYFLLGGVFLLFFLFQGLKKTTQGEVILANLAFKIPIFGELNRQVTLTSLVRTLGVLVGSGIAILDAIRLTSKTLGENIYKLILEEAAGQVEKGFPLSAVLKSREELPPVVGQMVAVGEETGTLDEVLGRLSLYFEGESEVRIKNLTTALEPLIIVVMGIGVAGLAVAVLMPLFNLVNVIK